MSKNDEFFYKDGSPYYGEYHMHQDGQAMTGASHEHSSVNIYRKNEIGKVVDLKKYNIKSTLAKKVKNIKMQNQKSIELAKEKGVETVVFDRGGHKYHGRVAALANAARDGGLKF